ncbi:MAG: 16S rRNA (guanine(527)-N(7))-methyltransferase RsmG [Bacteroidota bacterium]|nr:16S rRNA (guanine(527)-N(7))-methyltransferase RsmG [Bacteroidota bacterium]
MNDEELWLHTKLKKNGLAITAIQLQLLQAYKQRLLAWNRKINLISRKDEEKIWQAHIFLSLAILFKIDVRFCARILDLGTGGGLPGIPLSIMLPEIEFVLLDSIQKKVIAVESIISELKLPNVSTLCGRAEDIQKKENMSGSFDAVIARAVSNLKNLILWGYPFLKKEDVQKRSPDSQTIILKTPSLIAFKGGNFSDEIAAARRFFPKLFIHSISLAFQGSEEFSNSDKHLVIVQ